MDPHCGRRRLRAFLERCDRDIGDADRNRPHWQLIRVGNQLQAVGLVVPRYADTSAECTPHKVATIQLDLAGRECFGLVVADVEFEPKPEKIWPVRVVTVHGRSIRSRRDDALARRSGHVARRASGMSILAVIADSAALKVCTFVTSFSQATPAQVKRFRS